MMGRYNGSHYTVLRSGNRDKHAGTHFAHTFLIQSKAAARVMVLPTFKVGLLQHHWGCVSMVILNPVRLTMKTNPQRNLVADVGLFVPELGQVVRTVPYEVMALTRP